MAKEDLASANSLFSISSSMNQIAGFGIVGLLVLLLGVAIPIYYGKIEARKYVGKLLFVGVLGAGGSVALIGLTTVGIVQYGPHAGYRRFSGLC